MPFQIVRADYSKIDCDAVVLSTSFEPNAKMVDREGPDQRTTYGGRAQQFEARKKLGKIPAGTAAITPIGSYGIMAPRIIYTVCPRRNDTNPKLTKDKLAYLHDCYRSCLKIAVRENLKSIAFVLIGTRNRGYDPETSLTIAISEILHFLSDPEHPERTKMKIVLTVLEHWDFERAAQVLTDKFILPCIDVRMDDHTAEQLRWEEYASLRRKDAKEKAHEKEQKGIVKRVIPPTFQQKLTEYLLNEGITENVFYKPLIDQEIISRQTVFHLKSSHDYIPSKRVVLVLAMSLKLTLEQTEDLLASAGYAFIPSDEKEQQIASYFALLDFNHLDIFKKENPDTDDKDDDDEKTPSSVSKGKKASASKRRWKYLPLYQYFHQLKEPVKTLTFSQIEDILRFRLPSSYKTNKTMWYQRKNNKNTHTMADAWADNGYKLDEIDLDNHIVRFQKVEKKRT